LQATGAIPKPSALAQAPVAPQPAADGAQPAADGDENAEQGSAAESTQTPATAGAHPAASLIVQVAALANPDDAEVLVGALRKRGYQASAHREPGDGLIHVRIGPFASRELAEQWRQKLQSDGYNAVVQ
jgi:cell division septation protein DedD